MESDERHALSPPGHSAIPGLTCTDDLAAMRAEVRAQATAGVNRIELYRDRSPALTSVRAWIVRLTLATVYCARLGVKRRRS